jgi:hypothetical protein
MAASKASEAAGAVDDASEVAIRRLLIFVGVLGATALTTSFIVLSWRRHFC